jgi:phage-related protein
VRKLVFIGTSLADLKSFPDGVQDEAGHALWIAQEGGCAVSAKPLKGFDGASVVEIVINDGDAYRVVYTVALKSAVCVLHAFQKKSTRGIATAQRDIELIKRRLREAQAKEKVHG